MISIFIVILLNFFSIYFLDIGLRNIIDKLAEFVARNGPEFESMTKSKQKSNPKFGFLYGGEFYNYYMFKVNAEQAVLKQQMQSGGNTHQIPPLMQQTFSQSDLSQLWSTPNNNHPPPVNHSIPSNNSVINQLEALNTQRNKLREQLIESDQNLQGQHRVRIFYFFLLDIFFFVFLVTNDRVTQQNHTKIVFYYCVPLK